MGLLSNRKPQPKPAAAPALAPPRRPALAHVPRPAVVDPGPPPPPLRIDSFPEVVALRERIVNIKLRLSEIERRRNVIRSEGAETRQQHAAAVEQVLAGGPAAVSGERRQVSPFVDYGSEYERLRQETRVLRDALAEGDRRLGALEGSLAKRCITPELAAWQRRLIEQVATHLLAVAALVQMQDDAVSLLDAAGVPEAALLPSGQAVPSWGPERVGAYIGELIEKGYLPNSKPWSEARAWQ